MSNTRKGNRPPDAGGQRPARRRRRIALGLAILALLTPLVVWCALFIRDRPLSRAIASYERGDWREASRAARAILDDDPNRLEALTILARAEARLGRDARARSLYATLDQDRLTAEDFFLVGRGLIAEGQVEQGLYGLESAVEREPNHAEALRELARTYRRLQRLDEARGLASRLSSRQGWEVEGLILLGLVNEDIGESAAAAEAYRSALERDPGLVRAEGVSPVEVQKRLARCFLEVGQPEEASRLLGLLRARQSDDDELNWLQSRSALQQHDLKAAQEAVERAGSYGSDRPEAFEPAPYVGYSRCAECHPSIVQAQRSSRHAETFRARHDLEDLPSMVGPSADPATPGVSHALTQSGAEHLYQTRTPDGDMQALVEYVMGSGDRAMTLVGRDREGRWCELRLSYYGSIDGWDRSPGHPVQPGSTPAYLGQYQTEDAVRRCLGCHTTNGRIDPEGRILVDERGFSCERCHGPAGNHLDAVDLGFGSPAIGRPRLATAVGLNGLCGQCHSARGRGVELDDPNLARFQSTALPLSRCTTPDLQPLSCLDCHDPHRNAETSATFYEIRCLECHEAGPVEIEPPPLFQRGRVPCPVSPARGCISCHMPQVETSVPHTTFTDHWIRVHDTDATTDTPR